MARIVALMVAALAVSVFVVDLRAAAAAADDKPAEGEVEKITIEQFEEKRKEKDVVVLDVRTAAEFEEGHVPGATNLDAQKQFADRAAELDKDKTYLVYCASGRRSTAAAAKMRELGFDKLYNFAGSMAEWTKAGKPVEKAEGKKPD